MSEFAEDRGKRDWRRGSWITGVIVLSTALLAGPFIGETDLLDTLARSGSLLFGVGFAADLAAQKTGRAAYRTAIILTVFSMLLLGCVNATVGIAGSEGNSPNLLQRAVFVVAILGVILARFRPRGMSRALYATALVQAAVAVVAVVRESGAPHAAIFEIVTVNGFFVALFAGSGALFSRATRRRYGPPLM